MIRSGKHVWGIAPLAVHPWWPGKIAGSGIDFVFIDTEHVPVSRPDLSFMCKMYESKGIFPIVRVPKPDHYEVSKVVDAGAVGVIAPYCETVDQVKELVSAIRFKPLKGKRLWEECLAGKKLEPKLKEELDRTNGKRIVVLNIESVPAIENLDAMLAVPGVDCTIIGPHDLSCNLGIPWQFDHPKFRAAVDTIFKKSKAAGIGCGIHHACLPGLERRDQGEAWLKAGCNFFCHGTDLDLIKRTLKKELGEFKQYVGDKR